MKRFCLVCHQIITTEGNFCTACGSPVLPDPEKMHYAGFWIRLAAFIVDSFVISLFYLPIVFGLRALVEYWAWGWSWSTITTILSLSLFGLYHWLSIAVFGTTIGKWLYGLRVLDIHAFKKPRFLLATGRFLVWLLSFFLLGIGFLIIGFDKQKKALHDRVTKTRVVASNKSLVLPVIVTLVAMFGNYFIANQGVSYESQPGSETFDEVDEAFMNKDQDFQAMLNTPGANTIDVSIPITTDKISLTPQSIYERYAETVVLIKTDKAFGSGFIIHPDGLVVTNYHVVEDAHNVAVIMKDGSFYIVEEVLDYDRQQDMIVLKINQHQLPYVPIGNDADLSIGEAIIVIGNPEGFNYSVSDGIVSAKNRVLDDRYGLVQIDAAISSGSSGGPVFNQQGQVIGISTLTWQDGQNLNFATPITSLFNLEHKKIVMGPYQISQVNAIENYPFEEAATPVSWRDMLNPIINILIPLAL